MNDLRREPDGTVTAVWSHLEIRDARRGFYRQGRPLSPSGRRPAYERITVSESPSEQRARERRERYNRMRAGRPAWSDA